MPNKLKHLVEVLPTSHFHWSIHPLVLLATQEHCSNCFVDSGQYVSKQSKLAFYDQACNILEKNSLPGILRPVPSSKVGHYHLSEKQNKNLFSLLHIGPKDNPSLHFTFSEKTW